MYKIIRHTKLIVIILAGIVSFTACDKEYSYTETPEKDMPLRQIVGTNYGAQHFYVGMVPEDAKFFNVKQDQYRLLFTRQFMVAALDTPFFQNNLLKEPRAQYSDVLYRPYFTSARQYNMKIYAKAAISDNTSDWLKDESNQMNTPENIRAELTNLITHLSADLATNNDVVGWMEIVKNPFAAENSADYFSRNPWYQMGLSNISYQDGNETVYIPEYIVLALQVANQNAPDVKKVICQGGELNMTISGRMQKMLTALKSAGIQVDGIAWDATFKDDDNGNGFKWTLPANRTDNEKMLGELIDWCSRNRFQFHITSIELEMRNFDTAFGLTNEEAIEVTRDDQEEVLRSIMSVVIPRIGLGISTIHFNGMNDVIPATGDSGIKPRLYDDDNNPTALYEEMRRLLSKQCE